MCEPPFPPLDAARRAASGAGYEPGRAARPRPPRAHGRRAARAPGRPRRRRVQGRAAGDSKVGSRLVHGRHRKGGSSSGRFARRREGEARAALQAAADVAVRVLVPAVEPPGRRRARRRSPRARRGAGRPAPGAAAPARRRARARRARSAPGRPARHAAAASWPRSCGPLAGSDRDSAASAPTRHGGRRASADRGGRRARPARGRQRGRRRGRRRARVLGGRAAAHRARAPAATCSWPAPARSRRCWTSSSRRPAAAPTPPTRADLLAVEVSFGDAVQVFNCGAAVVRHLRVARRPGGRARALGLARRRRARRARRGAGPRGRGAQRRAGLRLRDPRADPRARRRSRARPSRPTAGSLREGEPLPLRRAGRHDRALRRRGRRAVLHGRPRRRRRRLAERRAAASSRAPTSPPTSPIARAPVRATYRGRAGPDQPAAVGRRDAARARHGAPRRALGRRAVGPHHDIVAVMEEAQALRTPEFVEGLVEPGFADRLLASRLGSTTHISVLDGDGRACAVTCTNGEGSGLVVPGTGIHVNNVMGEQDLNPLGFFTYPPGRRMPSMMAPDGGAGRPTARSSSCSAARAPTASARPSCRSSSAWSTTACTPTTRCSRRARTSRTASSTPSPAMDATRCAAPAARWSPSATATCSSAACRRSSATGHRRALGRRRSAPRRRRGGRVRRAAAAAALAALAALAMGACGSEARDLFLVTRSGDVPGARLTLRVTDDGRASCNGRPLVDITSAQLIAAREMRARPRACRRRHSCAWPPGAQPVFSYRVRTEDGGVAWSDDSGAPAAPSSSSWPSSRATWPRGPATWRVSYAGVCSPTVPFPAWAALERPLGRQPTRGREHGGQQRRRLSRAPARSRSSRSTSPSFELQDGPGVHPDNVGRKCEHGVILKIVSTNICGSDQHMVRGRTTAPEGLILGHEITGEVIETGPRRRVHQGGRPRLGAVQHRLRALPQLQGAADRHLPEREPRPPRRGLRLRRHGRLGRRPGRVRDGPLRRLQPAEVPRQGRRRWRRSST